MICYKITLIKDKKVYYATDKQKEAIDKIFTGDKTGSIIIGGDMFRATSIEKVQRVEINDADAPKYLVERYQAENANVKQLGGGKVVKKKEDSKDYRIYPNRLSAEDRDMYEEWLNCIPKPDDFQKPLDYIRAKIKRWRESKDFLDGIRSRMR